MPIIPTTVWWLLALLLFGWLLAPVIALIVLLRVVLHASDARVSTSAPTPYIQPSIEHPTAGTCGPALPAGA